MEITSRKCADGIVMTLAGRLDASWSDMVEKALQKAVHDGQHRLYLDMADILFISSAGIRVILSVFKQICKIGGRLAVVRPSEPALSVLRMAGLSSLVDEKGAPEPGGEAPAGPEKKPALELERDGARFQVYPLDNGKPFSAWLWGTPPAGDFRIVAGGRPVRMVLPPDSVSVGMGALGEDEAAARERYGEFLAVGNVAIHDPAPYAEAPDYLIGSTGRDIPFLFAYGLTASGRFTHLVRFETLAAEDDLAWSDLTAACLDVLECDTVVMAVAAEAAAFIGATVKRARNAPPALDLSFPAIRDQLSFTSEPAFQETSALVAGFASRRPRSDLAAYLRPVGGEGSAQGHFHAAVFPYRPIRKHFIALEETVHRLFEDQGVRAVLHLVHDGRPASGSGGSRVRRGACWIAPVDSIERGEGQ